MGFLNNLLGKKEPSKSVEKVEFSELPNWIASKREEIGGSLDEQSAPLLKELPKAVEGLKAAALAIRGVEMKADVPERIKAIVVSSKENYISKIEKAASAIDSSRGAIRAVESIESALQEINHADAKYSGRAAAGFPDGVQKIKHSLNGVIDIHNKISSIIDCRKHKLKLLSEIEKAYKEHTKAVERITSLEGQKGELSKAIKDAESERDGSEREILRIEASDRAEKTEEAKEELYELNDRKKALENSVLNLLSPLKRAFKKYAKAVEDGKASGTDVNKYSEDPVKMYLKGDTILPELLAQMMRAIQSGVIDLEPSEKESTIKKIRTISFTYLDKIREEHMQLCSRMRTLQVMISDNDVSKDIEKLKTRAESLGGKKADEEKKAKKIGDEIAEENGKLEAAVKKINDKVSEFGNGGCELVG